MRRIVSLMMLGVCCMVRSWAQLADGATAPDFTFTDINGNTHHLYSYLDSGKYVALEVSATWCHPCWIYHQTRSLDSLYSMHDAPGDNAWRVLFLEGDGNTTLADLQGTGTNTQGDWVTGTLTPIMNPTGVSLNDFLAGYDNTVFPTLYLICPNRKVFHDTLNADPRAMLSTWEYAAANFCNASGIDNLQDRDPVAIFPNPASGSTMAYFSLNAPAVVNLTITNMLGQQVMAKNYGLLQAGSHSLPVDMAHLHPGIYLFSITSGNDRCIRKRVVVE